MTDKCIPLNVVTFMQDVNDLLRVKKSTAVFKASLPQNHDTEEHLAIGALKCIDIDSKIIFNVTVYDFSNTVSIYQLSKSSVKLADLMQVLEAALIFADLEDHISTKVDNELILLTASGGYGIIPPVVIAHVAAVTFALLT